MACDVRFAPQAEADEAAIARYLAHDLANPQAAGRFLDELEALVAVLEQTPEAFPLAHEPRLAALGYRKVPVMRYLVLYRRNGDAWVITHIFHQSQDYARLV